MKIPFGDLSRQYKKYKNEFDSIITSVFEKGSFILGENLSDFEKNFASYLGIKNAIGVANGTEAIFLALKALDIGEGDEVITVSNTAVPTVSAIDGAGAKPVFVDILEDSYNINPQLIEEKISKKTKAIIPVHLYGNPCEMDSIMQIANKHGLKVIEDCAQAHGAKYKGKKVGTFGHISTFSFYPSKNLGANGDGGMIVTDDDELAEKVRLLRNYGFKDRYNSILRGYNSRLDELQAALLNFKLTKLDEWNMMRIKIAQKYIIGLKNTPLILAKIPKIPQIPQMPKMPRTSQTNDISNLNKLNLNNFNLDNLDFDNLSSYININNLSTFPVFHLFVARCKEERSKLIGYLLKEGISVLIHYPIPIHLQPAYSFLSYKAGDLPVTEKISQEILSIPIYPELEDKEIDYIIDKINKFYN
ncbi:MAG: DegT/DnrJ/EryC1/StrS family aminotransferase [Actinobacteria bacterium]|nr:DegT/DnrJ/EryC1/StrS family aminotransferase [Cyanobacteriota bacterium]MCL5771834.1 DegT/DnrJ/EryC1/StrS family aminotransferase [Actinomycetota bacterium]